MTDVDAAFLRLVDGAQTRFSDTCRSAEDIVRIINDEYKTTTTTTTTTPQFTQRCYWTKI
jgi:hypothetical protein